MKSMLAAQASADRSKPVSRPQREVLNDHNEVVENTVELEIKATAKWFKTLGPGEQTRLLKLTLTTRSSSIMPLWSDTLRDLTFPRSFDPGDGYH